MNLFDENSVPLNWSIIIVNSEEILIWIFIVVKNHFPSYMTGFIKSDKERIWKLRNHCILHWNIDVICEIVVLFINSWFWLWLWGFLHLFWILIITDHWFVHFVCSAYLRHSVVLWVHLLICCHKSFFSSRDDNRCNWWLLIHFYLIVLTDKHQVDFWGNNFLNLNIYFFVLNKGNVGNKSLDGSMDVFDSICQIFLLFF